MILTKEYLNSIAIQKSASGFSASRTITENMRFDADQTYDLFISHSYLDKTQVAVLFELFKKHGYNVYVDWKDDALSSRDNVTAETANKLKTHMRKSKGLAYITSKNASNSRWCPWELGYMDGKKGRCAIFPIFDKGNIYEFEGEEYLGLYPYIDYDTIEGRSEYEFWVNDPNEIEKPQVLRDWLARNENNVR